MRNVKHTITNIEGITVGLRKDGSVAVLFEDDSIAWFDSVEFNSSFEVA